MQDSKSIKILSGVALLLAVIATVVWLGFKGRPRPEPAGGSIYYTGPMKSKGDPNVYGDEEGNKVAPPPGVTTPAQSRPRPGAGSGI